MEVAAPARNGRLSARPTGDHSRRRRREREHALLRRYHADPTPELREELVRRFMPLARSLAMRYRRQTEPLEDLVQVASLGLVKAIDGFDPGRGKPFTAYGVPTILGELRRHFRDHVWNLRIPRGLQELSMKIDEAVESLTEELGRFPSPVQIADRIGIPTERVLEGLQADHARRTLSLDAPRGTEDDNPVTAIEMIPSSDPGYDAVEAQLASQSAALDDREWQVLRMRFVDDLTQQQIGARLGVSQMQISRISRQALWKLLGAVRGERTDGAVPRSTERGALLEAA